jgi:hypothetical protein
MPRILKLVTDIKISHTDFGNLAMWVFTKTHPRIIIEVKLMVKLKNLFRLKVCLGPCLEDASIKQHLLLHGGVAQ